MAAICGYGWKSHARREDFTRCIDRESKNGPGDLLTAAKLKPVILRLGPNRLVFDPQRILATSVNFW